MADNNLANCDTNTSNNSYRNVEISISVAVAVLNMVEVFLIKRQKKKNNFEIVLMSLSVADLLYGALNCTFHSFLLFSIQLDMFFNIRLFFMIASIFHLLFIAGDRLFAVAKPFLHKTVVTKRKLYWLVFLVWALSFSGFGFFQIYDEYTSSEPSKPIQSIDERISKASVNVANNSTKVLTTEKIGRGKTDPPLKTQRTISKNLKTKPDCKMIKKTLPKVQGNYRK